MNVAQRVEKVVPYDDNHKQKYNGVIDVLRNIGYTFSDKKEGKENESEKQNIPDGMQDDLHYGINVKVKTFIYFFDSFAGPQIIPMLFEIFHLFFGEEFIIVLVFFSIVSG